MVAGSFVLRINISGKNPAHRKSAKRYQLVRICNLHPADPGIFNPVVKMFIFSIMGIRNKISPDYVY